MRKSDKIKNIEELNKRFNQIMGYKPSKGIVNEGWEPTLPNKYPNSTVELLRNEFGKFNKSKYNHMSEVRDIV
jgi:hypothetical protein